MAMYVMRIECALRSLRSLQPSKVRAHGGLAADEII